MREVMLRRLAAAAIVAVMPFTMGSGCDASRREIGPTIGPAPAVDTVVGKSEPNATRQRCWELRIAKKGSTTSTERRCVSKTSWDRYSVGDSYP